MVKATASQADTPPAEVQSRLEQLEHGHRLRPTTPRARLVIVLLAVVTAVTILLAVLDPWARLERLQRPPPDRPACAAGQDSGCVGGRLPVMVVPVTPAPARPSSVAPGQRG